MTDLSISNGPLNAFIPLVKVDEKRRLIIGRAAHEVPDRQSEIMDYETAKPAFEAWSKAVEEASGGLSKGNVRAMHGRHAAGKLIGIDFNDKDKAIDVVAEIVDEGDWQKCLKGVYTGFSIGGGYARRWQDGPYRRYTPRLTEISLVDLPAQPTARFAELLKGDGLVEHIELVGRPLPLTFCELQAAMPPTFAQLQKLADAEVRRQTGLTFAALRKAAPTPAVVVAAGPRRPPFA